jgi:hypothetical protein
VDQDDCLLKFEVPEIIYSLAPDKIRLRAKGFGGEWFLVYLSTARSVPVTP